MRAIIYKKLLFIALLLFLSECSFASGALSTGFVDAMASQSDSWMAKLMPVGMAIGTGLWFIESIWTIKKNGLYDNGEKLLLFCLQRTLIFSVASSIFFNIDVYKHITEAFLTPANSISGGSGGLDPSSVWQAYFKWQAVWKESFTSLAITDIGAKMELLFYKIIYMICCIFISFEMIMLKITFLIILYAGCIFAGCYTSEWARTYWLKYISLLIGISMQTLVFCMIYSSIKVMFDYEHLMNMVGGDFAVNYNLQIISVFIGCLCLKTIPEKLGTAIGGTGAGSISAHVMQVAQQAASAAKGGLSTLIKSLGGDKNVPVGGGSGGLKSGGAGNAPMGSGSGGMGGGQPPMNLQDKANFMNRK